MNPSIPPEFSGGQRPADRVAVDLPAEPIAARLARRTATQVLEHWRLAQLRDAVTLVVSELVTNAVRHGLPPVKMVLARHVGRLQVDVHDASPVTPTSPDPPQALTESGRGLAIVEAVADRAWIDQVPDDGKIVHASFGTPDMIDHPEPSISLPVAD